MATVTKKDKFFEVLRNIFVGAKIEGNSGYVNLMKIKSKYYNEFKEQLHKDIDAKLKEVGQNFEEELYNKLFTFFKKYFSESGSIYFSYTPLQEKIYERIYRDDKDVMLFWKTHMLYYVKTERLFKNMEVEDEDIIYLFDVAELQHKKSNEKKDLVFELVKAEHSDKRRIHFSVKYSTNGTKTKIEEILKKIKKEKAFGSIVLKQIEKVLGIFKRQSEVDYFINKDAKGFLKEQFSLWIKGYLLDDESLFETERLSQLKALQYIAFNIIDLVGQFEDELVKVWNKPKFAHSSNYVITLDKIADKNFALLEKIVKHKGIAEQVTEWQELNLIDAKFELKLLTKEKKIEKKFQYLPIDTKFIKELETEIIALFENLDKELNGWLIHSENYQALNSLRNKFQGTAKAIYVDPPFNTGDDFDYADNYQDSTWITLMENRIKVSNSFLNKSGFYWLHLDYRASNYAKTLLENELGKQNLINEIIWSYSGNSVPKKCFPRKHDNIWFFRKSDDYKINFEDVLEPYSELTLQRYNHTDEDGKKYKISALANGNQEVVYAKEGKYPDDVWEIPTPRAKEEIVDFLTQKPIALMDKIIKSSTNENDLIIDYFSGSGTTVVTSQVLKRRWIGIEMGEHFKTKILPRLKKTIGGKLVGKYKETEWKNTGGGFFKYFALEQYEEALTKVKYEDKNAIPLQDIYHQYLFLKDLKLADEVVKLDEKTKTIKVDLTKLHPAIDIPETLSHLTGKFIKQIKKNEVIFTDGTSIDLTNIDYKIVKPLIWW